MDHEWQTSPSILVRNRTKSDGNGCPYCSGKKVSITNSLASCFPEVAQQWHPEKNGEITPKDIVAGTHKKYWWKCEKGPDHEWQATGDTRPQATSRRPGGEKVGGKFLNRYPKNHP